MRRRVLSFVAALGLIGGTVFAAWAGTARLGATADRSSDGRSGLDNAIAAWREVGVARLMRSMKDRARLVIDIEEESAAHEVLMAAEQPPESLLRELPPLELLASDLLALESPPQELPAMTVAPVMPLPEPVTSFSTHHRRIYVSDSGLAKVDLSAFLTGSGALSSVVIDGLPAGLMPMVGEAVDGGRWLVGREDFADFALVLGVGPEEQFDLRVGHVDATGLFRLSALIITELQRPMIAAVAPSAEAEPAIAPRLVTPKLASLPAETALVTRKEKPTGVTRSAPKKHVVEADDENEPVVKPSRKAAATKVVNESVLAQKPSALGARVSARSVKRTPAPAAETVTDAPWWTKAKHFTVEDIR